MMSRSTRAYAHLIVWALLLQPLFASRLPCSSGLGLGAGEPCCCTPEVAEVVATDASGCCSDEPRGAENQVAGDECQCRFAPNGERPPAPLAEPRLERSAKATLAECIKLGAAISAHAPAPFGLAPELSAPPHAPLRTVGPTDVPGFAGRHALARGASGAIAALGVFRL